MVMSRLRVSKLVVSLLGLSLSGQIIAATGNVGATSAAALAMVEATPMNFGSIVAVGNTTGEFNGAGSLISGVTPNAQDSAFLSMDLNGGTLVAGNGTTATLNALAANGTMGAITVTGAVASTQVRFTSPVMLDFDSAGATASITDVGSGDAFLFTDLILDTDGDTVMNNAATTDGISATVFGTTDVSGNISITAAGRLYTIELGASNKTYTDSGAYTGTYSLTVSY